MLVVAALGGNALQRRGDTLDAATMERNVKRAAAALAPIARQHRLIVTHGNGPQVGLLALQAAAYTAVAPYPLDMLGAETEGMIGYLLCRELTNLLPGKEVLTLLTQTVVSNQGEAFTSPKKFVGPVYDQATSEKIHAERGWSFRMDGDAYRRVVPSPEPCRILELPAIRRLSDENTVVICAGGGGIPVTFDHDGLLCGVEAVVDKDLASSWLAIEMQADALLLLTDVDGIYLDWHSPEQKRLGRVTIAELAQHNFPAGSMAPKIEAASRFMRAEGKLAIIGALEDAGIMLEERAGTSICVNA